MSGETVDRRFRLARIWSNWELRRIAPLFTGSVVNVSAGDDIDKEGGTYAEYFANASEYALTNYSPGSFRGFQGRPNEYLFDLTAEPPDELVGRFDVVLNHTTLEHVFEVRTAFANLCRLSRDVVIVVVPFAQVQHENEAYQDFWRFTPTCMERLFTENGLEIVYQSANNDTNAAVYLLAVGARNPDRWRPRMPPQQPLYPVGDWIGQPEPEAGSNPAQEGWLGRLVRRLWGRG